MGHCCMECKQNKKCKRKQSLPLNSANSSEYTIEKAKPKINMFKLEKKFKADPLYAIFGKAYILQKKNNM